MAVRKIAISVPEDVLKRVDKLAKKSKTTRSGFITEVLKQVSSADSRSEIIGKIDSLFGDPEVVKEQRQTSEAFLHAPRKIYGEEEW